MVIAKCMFVSNEQVSIAGESSHRRMQEALFLAWMGTLALCRVWALVNKTNSLKPIQAWTKVRAKTLSYQAYTFAQDANLDVSSIDSFARIHDFKHG